MKKFLLKSTIIILCILLGIVITNYTIDPARVFDDNYEYKMVSILNNQFNVTNIRNYDDRTFQKLFISSKNEAPDILIVGSSRTMLVGSEISNTKTIYNSSVTRAGIYDLIGLYQVYIEENILPEKIIFGIDPGAFNDNADEKRWYSLRDKYYAFKNIQSNKWSLINFIKIDQLISISYFQEAIKYYPRYLTGSDKPIPTLKKYNQTNTVLVDGSLRHNQNTYNLSKEQIKEEAVKGLLNNHFSLNKFDELSQDRFSDFIQLVNHIKSQGIEVVIFFPPFNPYIYRDIINKYPMINKVENKIKDFCILNNVAFFGSYNPYDMKINMDCFYDEWHLKESAINNVFKNHL